MVVPLSEKRDRMLPYKRYVEIGEGTHTVIMEKNRMELFQAVQQFLDERLKPNQ